MKQTVVYGDCVDVLENRTDRSQKFDLAVVDPPFNIGYRYGAYKDTRKAQDYLAWCDRWLSLVRLSLSDRGSLYMFSGDKHVAELKTLADRNFHLRSWIVWKYTFGVYCESKWGLGHQHILYYCCDPKKRTWNPDAVRIPSLRQIMYRDKRANPKGRVPCDVWDVPRICGTFKERTPHSCQTPIDVMKRIILASSNPGDWVLDPMCGSGTTVVAAKMLSRNALGIELDPDAVTHARQRLRKAKAPQ